MIVVDTNILIHFFFPSDFSDFSEKVFLKDPNWIAPILWRSEFKNVVLGFYQKNIIDFNKAIEAIEKAENRMQGGEHSVSSLLVMDLAKDTKCTSYDCEFVALAKVKEVSLVTWDGDIFSEEACLIKRAAKRVRADLGAQLRWSLGGSPGLFCPLASEVLWKPPSRSTRATVGKV